MMPMVGRKSEQQATQLVHAHLQFLRAVDSVQDVMVRAARDAREAIARGDADAVYAVATVLRRMVKAIEVDEWLAQEVAKGRDWAFVGELLVMLNGAHAAESVKPNGGLTGIAQFMAPLRRRSDTRAVMAEGVRQSRHHRSRHGRAWAEAPRRRAAEGASLRPASARRHASPRHRSRGSPPNAQQGASSSGLDPTRLRGPLGRETCSASLAETLRDYEYGRRQR